MSFFTERFVEDSRYVDLRQNSYHHTLMTSFENAMRRVSGEEHLEGCLNLQRVGDLDATRSASKIYIGKVSATPGL
jgi:hypothetical protein